MILWTLPGERSSAPALRVSPPYVAFRPHSRRDLFNALSPQQIALAYVVIIPTAALFELQVL